MNWFEKYKEDFKFKSNYAVSKVSGITRSSLDSLSKDADMVKWGTMGKLAKAAGMSLDDFDTYLKEQEEVIKMEKLSQIFVNYGLNVDWLDVLQEEGKVNLGNLEDLSIIDDVNNNTDYTAYFSNDFDGGVIIEK